MVSLPFQLGDEEVRRILATQTKVIVFAATSQTSAECPHCHTSSTRVHCHYQRRPQDMPISGKRVQVILHVRRFRCLRIIPRKPTASCQSLQAGKEEEKPGHFVVAAEVHRGCWHDRLGATGVTFTVFLRSRSNGGGDRHYLTTNGMGNEL